MILIDLVQEHTKGSEVNVSIPDEPKELLKLDEHIASNDIYHTQR